MRTSADQKATAFPFSGTPESAQTRPKRRRTDNDRVISVRLTPPLKRWLSRIAEESKLSEGEVAKRELNRFLLEEAKRRLAADHAAELEALGATSPNHDPETEAAHDAG